MITDIILTSKSMKRKQGFISIDEYIHSFPEDV